MEAGLVGIYNKYKGYYIMGMYSLNTEVGIFIYNNIFI